MRTPISTPIPTDPPYRDHKDLPGEIDLPGVSPSICTWEITNTFSDIQLVPSSEEIIIPVADEKVHAEEEKVLISNNFTVAISFPDNNFNPDKIVSDFLNIIIDKLMLDFTRCVYDEDKIILKEKIELNILILLSRRRIREIFPYAGLSKNGLLWDVKNPKDKYVRIAAKSFTMQRNLLRENIIQNENFNNIFPGLLRDNRKNSFHSGEVIDLNFPITRKTLFDLYVETSMISEDKALLKLKKYFGIVESSACTVGIDNRSSWRQCFYENNCAFFEREHEGYFNNNVYKKGKNIPFKDRYGRTSFVVNIRLDNLNKKYIILPETMWGDDSQNNIIKIMAIPPVGNLSLMKVHDGNFSEIYKNSFPRVIIITDSIHIANNSTGPDVLLTSWYGGAVTVDRVDWEILANKMVYYLLVKHSWQEMIDIYRTALAVYEQLINIDKIQLRYINIEEVPGSNDRKIEFLSINEFLRRAKSNYGLDVSEIIKNDAKTVAPLIKLTSAADITSPLPVKYLLFPMLPENTITMLHTTDSDNASWLAMSMAYAIATGNNLLNNSDRSAKVSASTEIISGDNSELTTDNKNKINNEINIYKSGEISEEKSSGHKDAMWRTGGQPRKVVYLYLKSKNTDNVFNYRLNKLKFMYGGNDCKLFMFSELESKLVDQPINRWLESISLHLKDIQPSLLVIDDYEMFGDNRHKDVIWLEILTWMHDLNKAGCSVLFLHPGKRYKAKADFLQSVLHVKPEKGYDSAISIRLEKCCDLDEHPRWLPVLELNLTNAHPCWEMAKPRFRSTEERDDKIIEMMLARGKRGKIKKVQEIADLFGVSRIRVYQIFNKKGKNQ